MEGVRHTAGTVGRVIVNPRSSDDPEAVMRVMCNVSRQIRAGGGTEKQGRPKKTQVKSTGVSR